jgi:glycosyltransferase involved in cell wall biosynthesis
MLVVVPAPVFPDRASGDRRLAAVLKLLESLVDVDLYHESDLEVDSRFGYRPLRGRSWANVALAGTLCRARYKGVLIEFWWVAERTISVARARQPWAACIVDSVDVHFLREQSAVAVGAMGAETVAHNKAHELAIYAAADAVIVVSDEERRALQAEGIRTPVLVIPNIVPLRERPTQARIPEVLFVGGFRFPPNQDGIAWFVRECWALVRQAVPEARLVIVGSNATREVKELAEVPGVEVCGYVPDTGPYLDRAAVSIAPLRYGGGMKGKVCEALASGVPVVTTSVGTQGIPLVSGISACIVDSPREFADAVVSILRSPADAERMGAKGREVMVGLCSAQAVAPQVQKLVELVRASPSASAAALAKWWWTAAGVFGVRMALGVARILGLRGLWRSWRRRRPLC